MNLYICLHIIEEYTLPNVGRFKTCYYSLIKNPYCYLILRTYSLYFYLDYNILNFRVKRTYVMEENALPNYKKNRILLTYS